MSSKVLVAALGVGAIFAGRWLISHLLAKKQEHRVAKTDENKARAPEPSFIDVGRIKPIEPGFNWRLQRPIPYRPWQNRPYHVTMGLKQVDVENWIELDETYLEKYTLKKRLFREHRNEVISCLPGCSDGIFEALDMLKETLVRRYPTMFLLREPHVIENMVTGDIWDLRREASTWDTHHPLEVMGLLATEDFYLLSNEPETGGSTLKAAGACFPGGFKIDELVGLNLWEIHAGKVPQYETKLAKSMDRFFQRLKVESAIVRFNHSIDDSGELFHRHTHHNLTREEVESPPTIEGLHLRVERQVLQRLPKTRALLFSIRTYVTPMTEVTKDKNVTRALRTTIGSYSEDMAEYKSKALWNDVLQRHIEEVLEEIEE